MTSANNNVTANQGYTASQGAAEDAATIWLTANEPVTSPSGDGWESLTAEALLTYCATQLGSIDKEIASFMNAQKTMMKKKEILQELKENVAGNNTVDKGDDTEKNKLNVAQAFLDAYNDLKKAGFPELAEQVNAKCKEWYPNADLSTGTVNTDGNTIPTQTDSEFQEKVGEIQTLIDDLGANMELNMIQLQSAVSKRQTAIQLTTNILDKYNKGLDQIAANMK